MTPTSPSTPDVAYSNFKQAEGTLTADQASLTSANAALTAAQAAQASAQTTVNTDTTAAVQAANDLIASLQAYVANLMPAPVPAPASSAPTSN